MANEETVDSVEFDLIISLKEFYLRYPNNCTKHIFDTFQKNILEGYRKISVRFL